MNAEKAKAKALEWAEETYKHYSSASLPQYHIRVLLSLIDQLEAELEDLKKRRKKMSNLITELQKEIRCLYSPRH